MSAGIQIEKSIWMNINHADLKRYFQFFLLVCAGGAIYPLLYLRQNFEITILANFGITAQELGSFYSKMGIIYAVTYLPSGWLADQFSPKKLICLSLVGVGGLGLWFSTIPSFRSLEIIFMGWGLAAGLTFWAALLKSVKLLASSEEQGRFFGILDGGRGLVEAVLATVAVGIFGYLVIEGDAASSLFALKQVIYMYSFTCIGMGVLILIFLQDKNDKNSVPSEQDKTKQKVDIIKGLKTILSIPQVWLMTFIILCGYQLFWATYSFSAYLQEGFGATAVFAGVITVTKLWMRPIGGIGAGFLSDKFKKEDVMGYSLLLASLGLLCLALLPKLVNLYFVLALVMLIGVLTYAIRGVYWSLLDSCNVPPHITGLAIGFISMLAYLPDIFLPIINAKIIEYYPGVTSYKVYFAFIAICGLLGTAASFYFKTFSKKSGSQV